MIALCFYVLNRPGSFALFLLILIDKNISDTGESDESQSDESDESSESEYESESEEEKKGATKVGKQVRYISNTVLLSYFVPSMGR